MGSNSSVPLELYSPAPNSRQRYGGGSGRGGGEEGRGGRGQQSGGGGGRGKGGGEDGSTPNHTRNEPGAGDAVNVSASPALRTREFQGLIGHAIKDYFFNSF